MGWSGYALWLGAVSFVVLSNLWWLWEKARMRRLRRRRTGVPEAEQLAELAAELAAVAVLGSGGGAWRCSGRSTRR